MSEREIPVADFYEQLSLLLKARLPLPECLEQLGRATRDATFTDAFRQMAADSTAGQPLADAMAKHPGLFDREDVALIRDAERGDGLPDLLFELAEFARTDQRLIDRCREAIAYPCFVIFFAGAILWFVFVFVVPGFASAFHDFSDGHAYSTATERIFHMMTVLENPALVAVYLVLSLVVLWSFGRGRKAYAASYWFIRRMPGANAVMRETDYTRLCRLWHLYLERGLPLAQAIPHSRRLLASGPLAASLVAWENAVNQGRDLVDTVRSSGGDGLFAMTLSRDTGHWDSLAEMYDARAESARDRLVLLWSVVAGTAMALIALWVAMTMFSPLIQMIEMLRILP